MAVSVSASLPKYLQLPNINPKSSYTSPSLKPFAASCPHPSVIRFRLNQLCNNTLAARISQSPEIGVETSGLSSEEEDSTSNSLESVLVFDLNGNPIPISDLWKDRKVIIAFARHFGCVFCRKRADYLATKKDIMDASGVALILIGPGNIDQAKTFVQSTKFPGEVYADPGHFSYEALKFVSGAFTTFTPKAGLKIIQLYMEGYRQDWKLSFQKDTVARGGWQQGGIIVAGPGETNVSYIHKDKEAGDDPDIEDVLKACCSGNLL